MSGLNYVDIEKEILKAPRFKAIPSVENVKQYLAWFGHPEDSFKTIHVAGTNGKGSTCSFLESIVRKHGFRTGLFTSPHLVTMRERMQINRELVEEDIFVNTYKMVKQAQKESGFPPLTFFELVTMMAVLIFKEKQVEYAIFETGMGGKYDATNALIPVISVITAIGMDHMQYLGDTLEKIAEEKAGIMKEGVPCVAVDHVPVVTNILKKTAEEKKTPLCLLPEDSYKILNNDGKVIDFSVKSVYYINNLLSVCSKGTYQAENGAVAATAAKVIFPEITDSVIREGLYEAFWPGRMEEIEDSVVIDGAHNEPSIQAFMNSIREDGKDGRRRILVFAVAADKDYDAMAEELVTEGHFRAVILTRIPYERMEDPAVIRPVFEQYTDIPIYTEESMEKAYEMVLSMREKEDIVYMAGSLYFVGALKEYLARKNSCQQE